MENQEPGPRGTDDLTRLWRQVGELVVRGQVQQDARFNRVEADIAVIKTDVAELKTDVAVLKTDVTELKTNVTDLRQEFKDHERASERRANRVEARFEWLAGLIRRDELKADR
jgi:septal ring factor EnvC (AmiA/AmiB activator)